MRHTLITLVTVLVISPALAQGLPTVPDDRITPGKPWSTDPAEICSDQAGPNETCEPSHHCGTIGSYSKRHRHTTASEKQAAYDAYGIDRAGRDFEVDHRIPLCPGGGDVAENRWPQEGWQHPSFHDKDRLEAELCRQVCNNGVSLRAAQQIFLGDWTVGYEQIYGEPPQ
jgi:hypothetical protein